MIAGLVDHLWQSTLFALAAGLVAIAFRHNQARIRYWLWLAASLKFFVPFAALIELGSWLTSAQTQQPMASAAVSSALRQFSQPFTATSGATASLPATQTPEWLVLTLLGAWLCGFAAIATSRAHAWRRIRAAMRASTPWHAASPVPAGIQLRATRGLLEPGVVGCWRPTILLPAGIETYLTPRQLAAVLAHEICHVRRRDNLTAALHMAVEAVVWFHPLVWWIGARLIDEREHACDEQVLREIADPLTYAESIVSVCKRYLEMPLTSVAGVGGSNITARIDAILSNRIGLKLTLPKRIALAAAGLAGVVAPIAAGAIGQAIPLPAFDVASVRAEESARNYIRTQINGDSFVAEGATVEVLIQYAYDLKPFQLAGGPEWIRDRDAQFIVQAKFAGEPRIDRVRAMVQQLLLERFQLQLRAESRPGTIYELAVARGGAKIASSKGDNPARRGCWPYPAQCTDVSMNDFADYLSAIVIGNLVVDKTGLSGRYDLTVSWSADNSQFRGRGGTGFFTGDGPSLFTALPEQAGLELKRVTGEIPILVVERVARPSAN